MSQVDPAIAAKVTALLAEMTLEEKVGQMNQYNGSWNTTGPVSQGGLTPKKTADLRAGRVGSMLNVRGVQEVAAVQRIAVEETRLGIPLIFGLDVIHGYETLGPIPLGEAASWDLAAIEKAARVAAREAAAAGINWTFAPMVDISRDARWGRVMEGGGEDTYLASAIAAARVRGFQGEDLSDPATIAACAKHFAGYGFAEAGREYNTVDVSLETLHNIILPPFKACVDAGVRTFMNAFNELNGIPATGHAWLQREILKREWGFTGFVVSDWASVAELVVHGYAPDGVAAARLAATAGSDMDMESHLYVKHLADLVASGAVEEAVIDDAVRRILTVKFELGLFDDPYRYCSAERAATEIGSPAIREAVLDMARKSIVLLKNENDLLPLPQHGLNVALIGPLAADKNSPLGSWRLAATDDTAVSVREGMAAYPGNQLHYAQGVELLTGEPDFVYDLAINDSDPTGIDEAVALARTADVVVLVLGEYSYQSGEARSRTRLDLPGLQQQLLEAVRAVNENVVLVLMNGRPLAIDWAAAHIPAIVEAWQLGTESGNAIAQVLYGDYNPSGKLPMSFPRSVGQVPLYYNHKQTGRPVIDERDQVFWSHYTDEANTPLFPFGYGLSYTEFTYQDLQLDRALLGQNEQLTVSVLLTNTGARTGREVVQLYLRDLFGSLTRPVRELKGFQLVELEPGASRRVTFPIGESDLRYWTANGGWEAEPGDFHVFVGGSSQASLRASFTYTGK
jgi:beta-glucosidase